MSFILADGWLITMNDRREVLERGSVAVEHDRITAIGSPSWPDFRSCRPPPP